MSELKELNNEETQLAYDYIEYANILVKNLILHGVSSNEVKLKFNEFVNKQQDLDSEFVKIVNDNFWDLL